jgi:hypothetical protein
MITKGWKFVSPLKIESVLLKRPLQLTQVLKRAVLTEFQLVQQVFFQQIVWNREPTTNFQHLKSITDTNLGDIQITIKSADNRWKYN